MSENNETHQHCNCEGHGKKSRKMNVRIGDGGIGWLGFWAYVGAAVYFVSNANGFWEGALGLLKALIWPAFLAYQGLVAAGI
jgi:hypothetical protein